MQNDTKIISIRVRHGMEEIKLEDIEIDKHQWAESDFRLSKLTVFSPDACLVFSISDLETEKE